MSKGESAMKVVHVVTGIRAESAGPSYSVPGLCRGLTDAGVSIHLHTLRKPLNREFPFEVVEHPYNYKVLHRLIPIRWAGRLLKGLVEDCKDADIVCSNGLWEMPCVYPAWAKKKTGCKLVTAPRGSLAENALKLSRFKKKVFSKIFQDSALRAVDMWHATSEKEYNEIRAAGFTQPVEIVPIGIDLPNVSIRNSLGLRKLVFLGRIHKIKGCDKLVCAWELLHNKLKDWELIIAGPDCGALKELQSTVAEKQLPRVSFAGEVNGTAKYELLASADLYVLPTETENFGITVAEALASATPVITTKGTLWSGLMGVDGIGRSGWWIENTVDELVKVIAEAAEMSRDALLAWGENGRKWMARDYSWSCIGQQMKSAYEWLLGQRPKPDFVRCLDK